MAGPVLTAPPDRDRRRAHSCDILSHQRTNASSTMLVFVELRMVGTVIIKAKAGEARSQWFKPYVRRFKGWLSAIRDLPETRARAVVRTTLLSSNAREACLCSWRTGTTLEGSVPPGFVFSHSHIFRAPAMPLEGLRLRIGAEPSLGGLFEQPASQVGPSRRNGERDRPSPHAASANASL